MGFTTRKGVKIFRDFYIDMEIKPPFYPKEVKIPLVYDGEEIHINKKVGDRVNRYEVVAVTSDGVFVRSSVNGVVTDIANGPDFGLYSARKYLSVKAEKGDLCTYPLWETETDYTKEKLLEIIKQAGIFNESYSKYLANTIDINQEYNEIYIDCVDEQPYDLSKTSVLTSYEKEVVMGAEILAKVFNIKEVKLFIMKNFCTEKFFKRKNNGVKIVKTSGKYPIFPKLQQKAFKKKGLLLSTQSCRAIYRAAYYGEAQLSSIVTVWGDGINKPCNLEVCNGTTVDEILNVCRAYGMLERVVGGGVLKGTALSLKWPLQRFHGCLTAIPIKKHHKTVDCINCGRCASVCPLGLAPYYLNRDEKIVGEDKVKQMCTERCVYCGACAYICPARIPLIDKIKKYSTSALGGKENE